MHRVNHNGLRDFGEPKHHNGKDHEISAHCDRERKSPRFVCLHTGESAHPWLVGGRQEVVRSREGLLHFGVCKARVHCCSSTAFLGLIFPGATLRTRCLCCPCRERMELKHHTTLPRLSLRWTKQCRRMGQTGLQDSHLPRHERQKHPAFVRSVKHSELFPLQLTMVSSPFPL